MYFEELMKSTTTLCEEKVRKLKEHQDQIKEVEEKLIELKKSSREALNQGNDEAYVKIGGMIAVNEAKLNRIREAIAYTVPKETIEATLAEINDSYVYEVGKRTTDILKMCEKMIKYSEELNEIFADYKEVIEMLGQVKGYAISDGVHNDQADINAMIDYYRRSIDPFCEDGNGRSIRAYAIRMNYGCYKPTK